MGFMELIKSVIFVYCHKIWGDKGWKRRVVSWFFGNGEIGIDLDGKITKIEFMKRGTNISLEYIATISVH